MGLMSKSVEISVSSSRYSDTDDSLAAASTEATERFGLAGWDLDPRWSDEERESITMTLPAHVWHVASEETREPYTSYFESEY